MLGARKFHVPSDFSPFENIKPILGLWAHKNRQQVEFGPRGRISWTLHFMSSFPNFSSQVGSDNAAFPHSKVMAAFIMPVQGLVWQHLIHVKDKMVKQGFKNIFILSIWWTANSGLCSSEFHHILFNTQVPPSVLFFYSFLIYKRIESAMPKFINIYVCL